MYYVPLKFIRLSCLLRRVYASYYIAGIQHISTINGRLLIYFFPGEESPFTTRVTNVWSSCRHPLTPLYFETKYSWRMRAVRHQRIYDSLT